MKKLILKWLGIADLREITIFNEALAKGNKQEIDSIMKCHIGPHLSSLNRLLATTTHQQETINTLCQEVDALKDKVAKLKPKIEQKKPVSKKLPLPKDFVNMKELAVKKTPPKKVTKK